MFHFSRCRWLTSQAHSLKSPRHGTRRANYRPQLDFLEQRIAPATYVVNDLGDDPLDRFMQHGPAETANGTITLFSALDQNTLDHGGDTILFAVAGSIDHSVLVGVFGSYPATIDATSAPGYDGSPVIELQGGLTLDAPGCTLKGLCINNSSNPVVPAALFIDPSSNGDTIQGNFIGTDLSGTSVPTSNEIFGIECQGSNETIGGTSPAQRNIISASAGHIGIDIRGQNNAIEGNFIGTDVTGTQGLGAAIGIVFLMGSGNTIGGTGAGAGNVISGNTIDGIRITSILGTTTGTVIQGNYIGTDATGTHALGNGGNGIDINGCANNQIGGTESGAGNVISGNGGYGVRIEGNAATQNVVAGNSIGVDKDGTGALGNQMGGVVILNGAGGNTIGGTLAGARNVISGNDGNGIQFIGGSGANLVQGNYIGTDGIGRGYLENFENGIDIQDSPDNEIGGTTQGARNVISGNGANGIILENSGTVGNLVAGNYIGTDALGTGPLANGHGIVIFNASGNTIGGPDASHNVISGNSNDGIRIEATNGSASQNQVLGNYIGTDVAGLHAVPNGEHGVLVLGAGAPNNTIGAVGAGNLISGNQGAGIYLESTRGNTVNSNIIGPDVTGDDYLLTGFGEGNQLGGVVVLDSRDNIIGGTGEGDGNAISGNQLDGLEISGLISTNNVVQGNSIGTQFFRDAGLHNFLGGVDITDHASNNLIGGPAFAKNRIAYNGLAGVRVDGGLHNAIRANSISNNGDFGILLVNGGNNEDPAPVLTIAAVFPDEIIIGGHLHSVPNTDFTVEYFSNADPSPLGHCEGKLFIGSDSVRTDGNGDATFTTTLVRPDLPGLFFTATATEDGNTSEFSNYIECSGQPPPGPLGPPRRQTPTSPALPFVVHASFAETLETSNAGAYRTGNGEGAAVAAVTGLNYLLAAQSDRASPDPEALAGLLSRDAVDQVFGAAPTEDGLEAFAFYRPEVLPGIDSETVL
jgi:hypothetical protein